MREIKFRAWDTVDGVMWEWPAVAQFGFKILNDPTHIPLQYTGLKDAKGKEIYEGDILQLADITEVYWTVIQDERKDFPRGWTIKATYPQYTHPAIDKMRVIGNIYETPELLKA